jgi:hypothetical protein
MGDCNNSLIEELNVFENDIPIDADRLLYNFKIGDYQTALYYAERILESTKNAIEVDKTLKDSIKYSMKY